MTKHFLSKRTARAAIVNAEFGNATVEYRIVRHGQHAGRIEPRIICANEIELARAISAGFDAEIKA